MTFKEFNDRFYLHDSEILKVEKSGSNALIVTMDFCFWMQDWYHEEMYPENGVIELCFTNVGLTKIEDRQESPLGNTILDVQIPSDHTMIFQMEDLSILEYYEIQIQAESVLVRTLQ